MHIIQKISKMYIMYIIYINYITHICTHFAQYGCITHISYTRYIMYIADSTWQQREASLPRAQGRGYETPVRDRRGTAAGRRAGSQWEGGGQRHRDPTSATWGEGPSLDGPQRDSTGSARSPCADTPVNPDDFPGPQLTQRV